MTRPDSVRADFDRIASLAEEGWNHNTHYHRLLLEHVPPGCKEALDLGCGTGAFSRLLAERCERVLALDLSPRTIQIARERSEAVPNVEFQVADAMTWEFPIGRFGYIASIATLHHLPLDETLARMKEALVAGGTLAVLDLYQAQGISDRLLSLAAIPSSLAVRLLKSGRLRESKQVREAWAEHGRHDTYLTLDQVRRTCARILPGARVRRHLLWRYSLTWTKPSAGLQQPAGGWPA